MMVSNRSKCVLGYIYGKSGRNEDAEKILKEMILESKEKYVANSDIALVCTGLAL